MKFIVIAVRNVFRYRHRSLVTTLTMALAGFIMILFAALIDSFIETSERHAVVLDLADIQIHHPGYRDDPDLYNRIANPDALLDGLHHGGLHASPRLYAFALAASGNASAGVRLRGIDPALEATVTEIHRHVQQGGWLDSDDGHGVVLGKKLARTLAAGVGDEVVIVGQASDGSMANDLYHVRGILKSVGDGVDRSGFYMTARAFRELMYMPQGVHEIAVMRPGREGDLAETVNRIREMAPGEEVLSWRELSPVIANLIDTADAQVVVMILITYVAVGMVILNAMLMSVFERIREFGVMKALGVTPAQLGVMVVLETLLQSLAAALLAGSSGYYIVKHFARTGFDFSAIASGASIGGVALEPVLHFRMDSAQILMPLLFLFVIALLAVIYPMVKAMLIEPVRAIHDR